MAGVSYLAAKTESLDQGAVALNVDALQVTEQSTTATNKQQKTTARVVVVLVFFQVFGQFRNTVRQKSNLDLGRTGVTGVGLILLDDGLFNSWIHRHDSTLHFLFSLRGARHPMCELSSSAAATRHEAKR
jgi:hypothetical protein